MVILGIETSCDETAAAVVADANDDARPWRIRSSIVASQVEIHREWGGVVPELASRQHIRDICGVVERALEEAHATWRDLGAVAVTQGPGLVGSLLVGVAFAKSLALSLGLPLVPVHHLAGHIESLFLHHGDLPLPAVVLVVSGGHTNLYLIGEPGRYQLLGRTRDDAAGEAYDKVARLLGLGYPGGPLVDRLAQDGNDRAFEFPVARMTHADRNAPSLPGRLDFSFSGLKTAVVRIVRATPGLFHVAKIKSEPPMAQGVSPAVAQTPRALHLSLQASQPPVAQRFSPAFIADVCASFQRAVVEALLDRTFDAAKTFGARSVGIAGGVSANSRLRRDATARGAEAGLPVFLPSHALSTDNAAMIAAAGLRRLRQGVVAGWDLNADATLPL